MLECFKVSLRKFLVDLKMDLIRLSNDLKKIQFDDPFNLTKIDN